MLPKKGQLSEENVRLSRARITIAKTVRLGRESRGVTQTVFGDLCGLSQRLVSQIECAQYELTLDTLLKLAQGLRCSVESLVRGI